MDIDVDVNVNPPELDGTINKFKELKKSMKDAIGELAGLEEGTEAYIKQAQKIGEIKDKINALNDSIKNTSGAPVENLTSSFGLLNNQLGTLDFDGAATSLKQFSGGISKVKIGDLTEGVKGFVSGLGQLGKALLANPIFLIAAVIVGVGAAVYALKDKVKFLSDAFEFVGKVIGGVVQTFKDLGDAIGLTTFKAQEASEAQIKAAQAAGDAVQENFDRQIKYAKAAGKETIDLEQQKAKAVQENLKAQILALSQLFVLNGKFNDEQKKQLEEIKKAYKASIDEQVTSQLEANKKKADDNKKHSDETIAANKALLKQIQDQKIADIADDEQRAIEKMRLDAKRRDDDIKASKASAKVKNEALLQNEFDLGIQIEKIQKDFADKRKAELEKLAAEAKAKEDKRIEDIKANNKSVGDAALRDLKAQGELLVLQADENSNAQLEAKKKQNDILRDIELQNAELTEAEILAIKAKYAKANNDLDEESEKTKNLARLQIASEGIKGIQALNDLAFSIKSAHLKKGSKEEEEAARKNFNINKAFQIAATTIQGIQNGIVAYGAGVKAASETGIGAISAPIVGAAFAAISAVGTLASIAKIASTQFGGSGGVANISGGGSGASPAQPPAPSSQAFNPATVNNVGGVNASNPPVQKIVVLEHDITTTQNKVSVIQSQARF